ncbi:phage-related hypothetical protein [Leptothrix cholodnii SP-6]|uniref:DUF2730 family protein n=1 Tax=Leptothrix cholodnii (strain ATCC 51168 / LMG 8142 / SP-6) TaxID=395495 RepID=B1Y3J1_LEPCP|nr:hypothetical protein [Leptothrix cholodnii]ACB34519.1 phage-related hypothetical protein [Leptothrix cholodnii SP-6]
MPAIPPEFKDWINLIQWLATGAIGVTVWLRKPGQDAAEAVTKLRAEVLTLLSRITHRVITVEEHIKHVPTSAELMELEGTVKASAAQTAGLVESMSTMRVQLNRIEAYLLNARDSRL